MSHVGVQRLAAGDRQYDCAQGQIRVRAVFEEEVRRVPRVDGGDDVRVLQDVPDAQHAECAEPEQHHGSEQGAHAGRAARLKDEQAAEDADGDGYDIGLEHRRGDFQPLYGGKYRHRGRDNGIPVKQAGAEYSQDGHQPQHARSRPLRAQRKRCQRHDAAFAAIVGTGDEHYILERHRDGQRPEDQRKDAEQVVRGDRHRVGAVEDFLHGVQRTGADIAIDHAHGCHRDRRQAGLRGVVARIAALHHNLIIGCIAKLGPTAFVVCPRSRCAPPL